MPVCVQPSLVLEMQSILSGYLTRNFTTTYSNNYPVWVVSPHHKACFARPLQIRLLLCAMLTASRPSWLWHKTQSGTGNSFNLQMRIRIPPNQVIFYRSALLTPLELSCSVKCTRNLPPPNRALISVPSHLA